MRLSVTDRTNHVTVAKDLLTVSYDGLGQHPHDAGVVRSDVPFAASGAAVHYFEVSVLNTGERGSIAVGMAREPSLMRLPGAEPRGFGLHGEDGRLYCDGSVAVADQYVQRSLQAGDVVGCGFQVERGAVFFTHNGVLLPVVPVSIAASPLFAVVGMHSAGEAVRCNFGARPFLFNVADMIQSLEAAQTALIDSVQVLDSSARSLIRHHLLFNAFTSTLAAFDAALPALDGAADAALERELAGAAASLHVPSLAQLRASAEPRAAVRAAILQGKIDETALPIVRHHWPALLELPSFQVALQQLRFQAFIELLRRGELAAAVAYARAELARYRGDELPSKLRCDDAHAATLSSVLGLLAYADVATSPLSALVGEARRQWLARLVNERVVSHSVGAETTASALEVARRHEHAVTLRRQQRQARTAAAAHKQ